MAITHKEIESTLKQADAVVCVAIIGDQWHSFESVEDFEDKVTIIEQLEAILERLKS